MIQKTKNRFPQHTFFDRDISWISFNERVLHEASRDELPLIERFRFLAIYSSNLDEFYRVRMPALMALNTLPQKETKNSEAVLSTIRVKVLQQLEIFGTIIKNELLPQLRSFNVHLIYNEGMPDEIRELIKEHFVVSIAGFIQVTELSNSSHFFPENNKLYFFVETETSRSGKRFYIVNIPSDSLSRFVTLLVHNTRYIVFLDDIIRANLNLLFSSKIISCHSFKITRDAALDLEDEFEGNLAKKIERKIHQRDFGLATRFLFEPGLTEDARALLKSKFNIRSASFVAGGTYHNLKDLASLPLKDAHFHYAAWPRQSIRVEDTLFKEIERRDILLHPPYHSYDAVLRFFNEASIDPTVTTIFVTLYRVAQDSRIVHALMSAAKNGKSVIVFVELKARFDEANNIKWSKKMKSSGVRIIESIPGLKVHAKLALVKRKIGRQSDLLGLFSTGNFNESTAKFYTDHVLMTSKKELLKEAEALFKVLKKRKKKFDREHLDFHHLLVGQFNLQAGFIALIDREISNAKKGLPTAIVIKFNNLEDRVLISKLYDASAAGVKISLIVRGICCLVPGVEAMSGNITVKRIVDRYLEHGRVFIFHNNNDPQVFLGSADWMNRNIYRRIEVCFPIYDSGLKLELIDLADLQLKDTSQAVIINENCQNVSIDHDTLSEKTQSQKLISDLINRPVHVEI